MFSKYSVKKPYTVIVGVVMVLLLGVISFMNSTTDLLPEMELPYVVVYTSYPGASAEKVENSLTKVLESSIGTTENLSNMSSVSSDNLSLIILQFADDTNMDTAMIDLNAKIDLVKGYLDSTVSTPTLLAINPNMLPIMMATVDYEEKDLKSLSEFVENKVIPELEKTKGVASVEPTGLLEETVQIVLDQNKIDEINNKVLASVNSELAKAERELRDSLKQVNEGLDKIKEGESELGTAKKETTEELAKATVQLQQAATNLIAMDSQVTQLKAEKAAFEMIVSSVDQAKPMLGLPADATGEQIVQELNKKISGINAINGINNSIQTMNDGDAIPAEIQTQLTTLGITASTIGELKTILAPMVEAGNASLPSLQGLLEVASKYDDAKVKLNNVDIEIATAEGVKQAASAMLTKAGIDVSDLSKLQTQLEAGKITAGGEFAKGEITIANTKASLESAKTQIEDGLKKIEESRDEALEQADISGIITSDMISNILMAENFSMPAGYIISDDSSILIKVGDEFKSIAELEDLVLLSMDIDGLEKIRLSDLAEINVVDNSSEIYTKVNGNDGVIISFQKTSTASTTDVCKNIEKRFDKLENENAGLHFATLFDQGVYINTIVDSVLENFLYGAILAIIILIIFLKDLKPTLVIALSIPISLMFSLVLMYFSGVTLNIISLSGLALGVGMLVDNSVVVVENIYRLRGEGVGLIKASIEGAKQVAGAIIASTLTTVCVFLPIVFATGIAKQLFVDMGLTIAYSLISSLIVALTLVPMLSSKLLKKENTKKQKWYEGLVFIYDKSLKWSLKHKLIVMVGVIALLLFSGYSVTKMGMTLIPEMESGQVSLNVTLLDDDATDEDAYVIYDEVMSRVKDLDGIETLGVTAGGGDMMASMMGGSSGGQTTTFYIITTEDAKISKLSDQILESIQDLPITSSISTSNMELGALGASGIGITLYGDDLDELKDVASNISSQLKEIEGIDEVSDGNEKPTEELRVTVNKNKAMELGLTVAQVYQTIASGVKEETTSTTLTIENKDYPVVIVKDKEALITTDTLSSTVLEGKEGTESKDVMLSEIASIENGTGMSSIYRDNSRRYITVSATIKDGYNVALVSREVEKGLNLSSLPNGVELEFNGENESINETMIVLVQMILLAIAFIYMIMVAQFQSLLSPFIVMFTIPLAFTGGLLALLITGFELSIVAMLGFLVLCGVVVNNGIVFIDYANQLRAQGYKVREALIETGRARLRPILMTALTTILAMTTMALGIGTGSEMMQGMAIVTIGGLTYATLLTLFVVPIMYELFNKNRKYKVIDENEEDLV
ncbi:efflux RND transporter permease subunit [Anaerorhabdus furcosa]|uniref:Hydrophobic/amphiphilic exporter-1, HAE1 family n=1 Tax=Anaerorhabdus furcosa TaxID=118967 RepID=A0A1T4L4W4_9FIRM|nr:efflux RND transporter permease subunit [Anaerorhabdus furcosa]SJZ49759.1 hydrophobic/amphiphilic exporter-1, HAE1 family [Anaerorhabdus furcosa]